MNACTEWLAQFFDELTPHEFYRVIFPEGELDQRGAMTKGKYTGIIIEVTDETKPVVRHYKDGSTKEVNEPVVMRHTVTDDLAEIDEVLPKKEFLSDAAIELRWEEEKCGECSVLVCDCGGSGRSAEGEEWRAEWTD